MDPIPDLKVSNLSKSIKQIQILKNVSLQLYSGQVLALVGPNGAGKTTLMNILTGRTSFDSAEIYFNNEVHTDFSKLKFSYCPQASNFDNALNVIENLRLYLQFRGASRKVAADRTAEMIEKYDLSSFQHTPMAKISAGMRKKVSIIRAIAMPSKFVFFDEPSAALDANHRNWLLGILKDLKQNGCGVVISSHDLNEIDMLADELVLIEKGEIVASGSSKALIGSAGFSRALEFFDLEEAVQSSDSDFLKDQIYSYVLDGKKVCLFKTESLADSFLNRFRLRNFSIRDSNLVDFYYWKTGKVHEL